MLRISPFATSSMVWKTVSSPSRSDAWFCAKYPICTLCPICSFPWFFSCPMMHLTRVDLPSPFRPTKAILSPLSTVRLTPLKTVLLLNAMATSFIWTGYAPLRGEGGNFSRRWLVSSSSTSMSWSFSSIFTRLCTWSVFEYVPLKRSMKSRVSAMNFCCSSYFLSCCWRRSFRSSRYWLYEAL